MAEIAEIVDLYDAPCGEGRQLKLLIGKIAVRRAELKSKRRDIDASLKDLDNVLRTSRKRMAELKKGKMK